jgi:hypothetical protein
LGAGLRFFDQDVFGVEVGNLKNIEEPVGPQLKPVGDPIIDPADDADIAASLFQIISGFGEERPGRPSGGSEALRA